MYRVCDLFRGTDCVNVSLDPGQESTADLGTDVAWAHLSHWPLAAGAGPTCELARREKAENAAQPIPHLPLPGALLFYGKLCLIVTSTGRGERSSVHSIHCILLCK